MQILQEWIETILTEEQEESLRLTLSSRYVPLLASGLSKLRQLFRQPVEGIFANPIGEIFVPKESKNDTFCYYLKNSSGTEFGTVGAIDIQKEHSNLIKTAASALESEPINPRLRPLNPTFATLSRELGIVSFMEEENAASRFLEDPSNLSFLRELNRTGRLLLEETNPQTVFADKLEQAKLVRNQYSIFCRQTGNQIMMVDASEAIQEASRQGFKCFACGRAFPEEKLIRLVSPTPYGQKMSTPNYWLLARACQVLASHQIAADFDGELSTLFIAVGKSLILGEIKETPYSLQDAYLFIKKVVLYKPATSFLLLLSQPAPDVATYLSRALAGHPLFISDSLNRWTETASQLIGMANEKNLAAILQKFSDSSAISLEDHVSDFLLQKEEPPEISPQARTPVESQPPQEVKPFPAVSLAASETQVPHGPTKNDILKKLLETLSSGTAMTEPNLHLLLQDLNNADARCKACVVSEDGLLIASAFQEDINEIVASCGSECFLLAQKFLRENDSPAPSSLSMASKNFSVEIFSVSTFYLVIVTTLETLMAEPLSEEASSEAFQAICSKLIGKEGIRSVGISDQNGLFLEETGSDAGRFSQLFPLLLELFPKLSACFSPLEQGSLESASVTTSLQNVCVTRSGAGNLCVTFDADARYEDFAPYILAAAAVAAQML